MTVKDLKEYICKLPDGMRVVVDESPAYSIGVQVAGGLCGQIGPHLSIRSKERITDLVQTQLDFNELQDLLCQHIRRAAGVEE